VDGEFELVDWADGGRKNKQLLLSTIASAPCGLLDLGNLNTLYYKIRTQKKPNARHL
jgi:hypothetical protein